MVELGDIQLKTTRGMPILEHAGHFYRWNNQKPHLGKISRSSYYECVHKRQDGGCSGRLVFYVNLADDATEIKETSPHTCFQLSAAELLVKKAKAGVRQLVQGGSKPTEAYNTMTVALAQHPGVSDHEAAQFGQLISMRRSLDQVVNTRLGNPPKTLADLVNIPPELCVTHSDDPFLLVFTDYFEDNGTPGPGPIIVYATEQELIELFRSEDVRFRLDCSSCSLHHVLLVPFALAL
jgi:hypothetical protein